MTQEQIDQMQAEILRSLAISLERNNGNTINQDLATGIYQVHAESVKQIIASHIKPKKGKQ